MKKLFVVILLSTSLFGCSTDIKDEAIAEEKKYNQEEYYVSFVEFDVFSYCDSKPYESAYFYLDNNEYVTATQTKNENEAAFSFLTLEKKNNKILENKLDIPNFLFNEGCDFVLSSAAFFKKDNLVIIKFREGVEYGLSDYFILDTINKEWVSVKETLYPNIPMELAQPDIELKIIYNSFIVVEESRNPFNDTFHSINNTPTRLYFDIDSGALIKAINIKENTEYLQDELLDISLF